MNSLLAKAVCAGILLTVYGSAAESAPVDFNRDIRPLLADKCFNCHGRADGSREGNLRLDLPDGPEGALTDRDGTIAVKPRDLKGSELWDRISTDDESLQMPPADSEKKPFSEAEKKLIKQWILEGGEVR